METAAILAMLAGFMVQNYAEWRGAGPRPPRLPLFGRVLQPPSTASRLLALLLASLVVLVLSAISIISGSTWFSAGIAGALIANSLLQSAVSLLSSKMQPGTIAGLVFMLPPSLWVVIVADNRFGWLPVLIDPPASLPILMVIWWISKLLGNHGSAGAGQ